MVARPSGSLVRVAPECCSARGRTSRSTHSAYVPETVSYSRPSFAQQQLKIPASTTFLSTAVAWIIYLVLTPVMGALSDKIGRKTMFFAVSALSVVLAYPLFQLLVSVPMAGGLILTQAIASVLLTMYAGPICAILAEMFPTRVRYTALSVSYGLAVAIFGGFAPYISSYLIQATADPLAPAFYVMISGALSFLSVLFVEERAGKPLPDEASFPRGLEARAHEGRGRDRVVCHTGRREPMTGGAIAPKLSW
jgi:MFS family permease